MKAIFVAGTDTNIGKTIVTGCLARYILENGRSVITQKWVQTGAKISSDIKIHYKIMAHDIGKIKKFFPLVSPYIFNSSFSPHLASRMENKKININKIKESFHALAKKFDYVIVEGVGGLLVPFNEKKLLIDIVKDLNLEVLLVAENKLGAINHTLLSVEALKSRRIKILGIVFNNIKEKNKQILKDNPSIIKILSRQKILGILPKLTNYKCLYANFIPIGKQIFNAELT